MKKIILSLIIIVLFLTFTNNMYSQCPTGFSGPYTTIIPLCGDTCKVEIEWCCNENAGPFLMGNIHINSMRFLINPLLQQNACWCLQWVGQQPPQPGYPAIPFDKILTGIFNSGHYCNEVPPIIPPCDPPGSTKKIKVTYGGCYHWVSTFDFIGYQPCNPSAEPRSCHQDYEICRRLVNGVYVIETITYGNATPQFECEPGCVPICNFITY